MRCVLVSCWSLWSLPLGLLHSKTAVFWSISPPGDLSQCEPGQSNNPWVSQCFCLSPGWSAGVGWSPSSARPHSPLPRSPWCWSACASPGRWEASPCCLWGRWGFSCCGSRLEVKLRAKVASVFHAAVSSLSRVSLVRAGGGCFLCWAAGKVAQRDYRVKVKGQPHQVSTAKWSTTACVEKRYDPSPLWENISIHYLCQIPHPSVA